MEKRLVMCRLFENKIEEDLDFLDDVWFSDEARFWLWFGLVSLFNGISTLFRLFNAKSILLEEQ